jgi:hypothetical protein
MHGMPLGFNVCPVKPQVVLGWGFASLLQQLGAVCSAPSRWAPSSAVGKAVDAPNAGVVAGC